MKWRFYEKRKSTLKNVKSFILKALILLSLILIIVAFIFQREERTSLIILFGVMSSCGMFLFLMIVCNFEIIEKHREKSLQKYNYKINGIGSFITIFEDNIKNDGFCLISKQTSNNNDFYIYNKYDYKLIDDSVNYWYVIATIKNDKIDYYSDYDRILTHVMNDYNNANHLNRRRFDKRITSVFVMDNEDSRIIKVIRNSGYTYEKHYHAIITAISVNSQTIYIPRKSNTFETHYYMIMKNKLLKLLNIEKGKSNGD